MTSRPLTHKQTEPEPGTDKETLLEEQSIWQGSLVAKVTQEHSSVGGYCVTLETDLQMMDM